MSGNATTLAAIIAAKGVNRIVLPVQVSKTWPIAEFAPKIKNNEKPITEGGKKSGSIRIVSRMIFPLNDFIVNNLPTNTPLKKTARAAENETINDN